MQSTVTRSNIVHTQLQTAAALGNTVHTVRAALRNTVCTVCTKLQSTTALGNTVHTVRAQRQTIQQLLATEYIQYALGCRLQLHLAGEYGI